MEVCVRNDKGVMDNSKHAFDAKVERAIKNDVLLFILLLASVTHFGFAVALLFSFIKVVILIYIYMTCSPRPLLRCPESAPKENSRRPTSSASSSSLLRRGTRISLGAISFVSLPSLVSF